MIGKPPESESEYEEDYIKSIDDIKEDYYPIFKNSINGYSLYY